MRRSLLALLAVGLVVAAAVLLLGPRAETPAEGVLPQPGEHAPAHEPSAALPAPQPRSFASPEAIEPHPPTRDPAAALRLLVRSRAGAVIAGAELWMQALAEGEVFERIGATDDAGVLAHPALDHEVRALATHPDFAPAELRIAAHHAGEVLFELPVSGRICGRVVDEAGVGVASGPWILAHPDRVPPTKAQVRSAVRGLGRGGNFALTRADATGRYELDGLDPARAYRLHVGGFGRATAVRLQGIPVGESDRVIVLQRTFAAHLRFGGPEGAPLQADARLWGRSNPTWFWNVAELEGVGTDSILAVLLGIDLEKTQRQPSDGGATLLFLSADEQAESVGPIQVRGSLIGHAPVSTELRIPAYRGQLAELSIPLESLAAAWGELRVRFVGLRGGSSRRNTLVQELGTLSVRSLDDEGFFEQKLRDWSAGELVLGEVPVGRYAVFLHSPGGYSGFEPREGNPVFVGVGETTVTFDLSASREVEVQVRLQDGELHSSEIVLDLQHDGASRFLVYSAAPYVLRGLLPRTYDLELFAPFHGGDPSRLDLREDPDPGLLPLVEFVQPPSSSPKR